MRKLNNKGFAITGILYTVFILFLMILLSVLSGLNIKKKLLEKNISDIKESLEEKCSVDIINISGIYNVEKSGKYTIDINGTEYQTYLSKGQVIDDLTKLEYINDELNNSITSFKIVEICTTGE